MRELFAKNLVPVGRVTVLERDAARLQGERGQLVAATASARGKITETELQILQVDGDMRAETARSWRRFAGVVRTRRESASRPRNQLKRVDLRAPQDGVVHQLAVHTVGGLVTPAEPGHADRADERPARRRGPGAAPGHRQREPRPARPVAVPGLQPAHHAGDRWQRGAGLGRCNDDPKTGASHYTLRILVPQAEKDRLGGARLVPGMPVEAFLQIGERSVLSYLVKPTHRSDRQSVGEK